MCKVHKYFLILSLSAAIGLLSACSWAQVAAASRTAAVLQKEFVSLSSYTDAKLLPGGKGLTIVDHNTLKILDNDGQVVGTYIAPKKLGEWDVTLGNVHSGLANGNYLAELRLSEPGNPGVSGIILVCITSTGKRVWKRPVSDPVIVAKSGRTILERGHEGGEAEFLDMDGKVIWRRSDVYGYTADLSPDGEFAVIANEKKPETVVIGKDGKTVWSIPIRADEVAISSNGSAVAVYTNAGEIPIGTIRWYDVTGRERWHKDISLSKLRISENSKTLLVGVETKTHAGVSVFDSTGTLLWDSPPSFGRWRQEEGVFDVSPDGNSLLVSFDESSGRSLYLLSTDGKLNSRVSVPSSGRISWSEDWKTLLIQDKCKVQIYKDNLFADNR